MEEIRTRITYAFLYHEIHEYAGPERFFRDVADKPKYIVLIHELLTITYKTTRDKCIEEISALVAEVYHIGLFMNSIFDGTFLDFINSRVLSREMKDVVRIFAIKRCLAEKIYMMIEDKSTSLKAVDEYFLSLAILGPSARNIYDCKDSDINVIESAQHKSILAPSWDVIEFLHTGSPALFYNNECMIREMGVVVSDTPMSVFTLYWQYEAGYVGHKALREALLLNNDLPKNISRAKMRALLKKLGDKPQRIAILFTRHT